MARNRSARSPWTSIRRAFALLPTICLLLVAGPALGAEEQPYRPAEIIVHQGDGQQSRPIISGDRVFWRGSDLAGTRQLVGRDIAANRDIVVDLQNSGWPTDLEGDNLLVAEGAPNSPIALAVYHLPDGSRRLVVPPAGGDPSGRASARISGNRVVWTEGGAAAQVFLADLVSGVTSQLTTIAAPRDSPAISGNLVVWLDRRNTGQPGGDAADIYGYDLAGKREFRITSAPDRIGSPAISGGLVVWSVDGADGPRVVGYDLPRAAPLAIAALPAGTPAISGVDVSGDLVVWSARVAGDEDVFGYDLRLGRSFVVSRAIGSQVWPRIAGRTIVWTDTRNSGLGKYQVSSDIYGARLEPGPAAAPVASGAPRTADARIEIVWPHGGAPVAEATQANVAAFLFESNSSDLAPCQWNPRVELYRAVNGDPARLIALGHKTTGHYLAADGGLVPTWSFDDVDVSLARDPGNRLYFFLRLAGYDLESSRTSVWTHAVDGRTHFPTRDVPAGLAPGPVGPEGVEAKIEIVWPHDDAPVTRARLVNVSAFVFKPGTLLSVPADFTPRVRLYRALNNGYLEPMGWGTKRIVQAAGFAYPTWDFDDIEVAAATDPANRYYFTLEVEGVSTATNVWAHGADARTFAPSIDRPPSGCR
jgi:beta propeller repeat protein